MRVLMGVVVAMAVLLGGCSESSDDSEGATGHLGPRFELPGVVIYFPGPIVPGADWDPAPGLGFVNGPLAGIDQVDKVATAEGVSPYGEVTVLSGPEGATGALALGDAGAAVEVSAAPEVQRVMTCDEPLWAGVIGGWLYVAVAPVPVADSRRGVLMGRVPWDLDDVTPVAVFMAELFSRATNEDGSPLLECGSEADLQDELLEIFRR